MVGVIHHPEAHQKRISLNCPIVDVAVAGWRGTPDQRFTHQCDTEGGSSGAPVFDVNGDVVGLHHHGFAINPQTCSADDKLNKAVRIDAIVAWLKSTPARLALLQRMTVR
jgi:hypothetical protein